MLPTNPPPHYKLQMTLARIGNLDIAFDDFGSGPPVLLIMGFGAQRILWDDEFCDLLVSHGLRVIRFDNRDVGESSRLDELGVPHIPSLFARSLLGLPLPSPPYRLEDMADDAVGLLDHLGIAQVHVVGASMGGMIAQTLAIRHASRLTSLTSIMSSPGGRRNTVGNPSALRALLRPRPADPDAQVEAFVDTFRVISGKGFPFPEERIRRVGQLSVARGVSPRGTARQFAAILESSGRRRKALRDVRVPTLVIHGVDDPLIPLRAGRATAKHIRGAEFMAVAGMGHDMPPEAFPLLTGAIATHVRKTESGGRS